LKRDLLRLSGRELRATTRQPCSLSYKHLSFQENKDLPRFASGGAVKTLWKPAASRRSWQPHQPSFAAQNLVKTFLIIW